MAEFKKMWTEKELKKKVINPDSSELTFSTHRPGTDFVYPMILKEDSLYLPYALNTKSNPKIVIGNQSWGDLSAFSVVLGINNGSPELWLKASDKRRVVITPYSIQGIMDFNDTNLEVKKPLVAPSVRQESIEITGNAMKDSSNVGTYTIKYIPLYDKYGNLVGGSGTIAISLTSTIADSMVALEGAEDIKATIMGFSSSNTAVAGAIVSGILVCAIPSTNLSGDIEGSISIFNN